MQKATMKRIEDIVKSRFYIPLSFSVFVGLLMSRRWWQIVSPQVWDEDGTQVIFGFMTQGWLALFESVNGYSIVVPKIISMISLWVSFLHYPLVSTILAWIFIGLVGLAITIAPTKLHGKFLCALSVFIIPSNPEVFGLPLYTFWWASLLLFLVTLWDEKHPALGWRLCFTLLGGLSSPVIFLILPVLYFRAYQYRSLRSEYVIAIVATLIALIQISFLVKWPLGQIPSLNSMLLNVVPVFFGNFLIGNWTGHNLWIAGVGMIAIVTAWFIQARNSLSARILLFLLAGSIAMSVTRVDPSIIHPNNAGPRYFFFPFALMAWILVQSFYSLESKWHRGFITVIAMVALLNAAPAWSRRHDDLQWADHVRSCRLFHTYSIPVHFDGDRSLALHLRLLGQGCAEFLRRDLFASKNELEAPTFAYTMVEAELGGYKDKVELISNSMSGSDSQKSKLSGYQVIGSFNTSDADTGDVLLKLRRGDHILYRSGPSKGGQSVRIEGHREEFIEELPTAIDWVTLEFSNANLPAEFVVKIKDEGQAWGQWSAIAIRN